tara:strand:- start:185 stop:457 length:273 start_codon:yes stop_codon:yes gene_type:complete
MPNPQNCSGCPALYDQVQNVALTGGSQIVPVWPAITPDALTHGVPCQSAGCGGGYFNIMQAYGSNAACCNQQYTSTGCRAPGVRRNPWGY